jgi:hypothetical protein
MAHPSGGARAKRTVAAASIDVVVDRSGGFANGATSAGRRPFTILRAMVPRPPRLRLQLVAAVLALLAIVGMHALDTNAHVCHTRSAVEPGGGEHHDGHGHHEGSAHASRTTTRPA